MSGDLAQLAGEVTLYVTAAATAYGGAVLAQVQDETATAVVGFGRRMAQRIFGGRADGEEPPEELADVIDDPEDADNVAALRKAIRKALAADAELAARVARLAEEARDAGAQVMTLGDRSPAVHTNHGVIATGDHNGFTR
ncbi:hypothetical protein ABZ801_30545 [Actinomadura sp. NPDC047616]|uniref:hypothetical protein n=1 Tax=Actinomadura sp. NPDC047616 TaxID=3155914 RepID=UPI0033ED1991